MPEDRRPEALGRADVRRCGSLWVATSAEAHPAQPSSVPGARIRAVATGDTEALRRAMVAARADNPNLAEVRILGGRLGYLIEQTDADTAYAETSSGTVLSYGWIARAGDTVDDLGFPLEMPPSEGWIYDCATIPAARGRGLYTALLRTLRAEFPRYGLERGWIGTEPSNWASQRGIARAGFQKVADIDWDRELATVFGAPGFPEAALFVVAMLAGDGERSRVLPEAGIPWVEAILTPAGEGAELEGLRAFRKVYGEQIHWSLSRDKMSEGEEQEEEPYVILRCDGNERTITARATFGEYARALDELAPGLPWLVE